MVFRRPPESLTPVPGADGWVTPETSERWWQCLASPTVKRCCCQGDDLQGQGEEAKNTYFPLTRCLPWEWAAEEGCHRYQLRRQPGRAGWSQWTGCWVLLGPISWEKPALGVLWTTHKCDHQNSVSCVQPPIRGSTGGKCTASSRWGAVAEEHSQVNKCQCSQTYGLL